MDVNVVRSNSTVDEGLDGLQLDLGNLRQRFESGSDERSEDRSTPGSVSDRSVLQRSESILIRLKRYQSAVSGERKMSQNGNDDAYSSGASSDVEEVEGGDDGMVRESKHREKAIPFSGLSSLKNQWESGSVSGPGPEETVSREDDTKNELFKLRQRVCLGRSASMRQMYEKVSTGESIETSTVTRTQADTVVREKAVFLKERFEKGLIENETEEVDRMEKMRREKQVDLSVVTEAETVAREAKSMFKQMDATQAKSPPASKPPHNGVAKSSSTIRLPENVIPTGEIVRSSDPIKDEVTVEICQLKERFKYFENFEESPKEPKRFEMTPPRDVTIQDADQVDAPRDPNVIRSSDVMAEDLPKTDTAKKLMDKFKRLESQTSIELQTSGPKPLKRITPPRDIVVENNKTLNGNTNGSNKENGHENEQDPVERDPNIVKSTYKTEDIIPVEPEMARSLKAKFENWAIEIERENCKNNGMDEEDYTPQLDTAKNLRAKFEAFKDDYSKPLEKTKPRVNRFVHLIGAPLTVEVCSSCGKRLYPMEKLEFNSLKMHKNCFKCSHCSSSLRLENYTLTAGKFYCIAHFKQLFMAKGNYDEGFGREQHKEKWSSKNSSRDQTPDPEYEMVDNEIEIESHEHEEEIEADNGLDVEIEDEISIESENQKQNQKQDQDQNQAEVEEVGA